MPATTPDLPRADSAPAPSPGASASALPPGPALRWVNRYATLGEGFVTRMAPDGLGAGARWGAVSPGCTALLGWPGDWWQRPDWDALRVFSGEGLWPGMAPLASVYSGHQFGQWAGQLGDGRALLLGEVEGPEGQRLEVQLKGAGRTPYSRMGDGRAVLRSTIREYLCSEAMAGLGIPTTRALCFTASPLPVRREEPETAAVVTRVAPSFLRFGHFEHFCHHGQHARLRTLLEHVLTHHFPDQAQAAQPVLALLTEVSERTGRLLADWQAVGFCHGVMNTDNMSLLGLTIDYGPFGFLDGFDPQHICNHSDHQGRYAFARQPGVAFWNLHALAQALLPLVGGDGAERDAEALRGALEPFRSAFGDTLLARLRAKLGLATAHDDDGALADDWLRLLAQAGADHTLSWRRLSAFDSRADAPPEANATLRDHFIDRAAFDAWAARYAARLRAEGSVDTERAARMDRVNPRIVLRNHLAELAIRAARDDGDFGPTQRLAEALAHPFDDLPGTEDLAAPPPDWAAQLSVSCSS